METTPATPARLKELPPRVQQPLHAYLRDHAPRMRAEGVARFGDGVRARRRSLRPAALG